MGVGAVVFNVVCVVAIVACSGKSAFALSPPPPPPPPTIGETVAAAVPFAAIIQAAVLVIGGCISAVVLAYFAFKAIKIALRWCDCMGGDCSYENSNEAELDRKYDAWDDWKKDHASSGMDAGDWDKFESEWNGYA